MQEEVNSNKEVSQALLRTWANVCFCVHIVEDDLEEYDNPCTCKQSKGLWNPEEEIISKVRNSQLLGPLQH